MTENSPKLIVDAPNFRSSIVDHEIQKEGDAQFPNANYYGKIHGSITPNVVMSEEIRKDFREKATIALIALRSDLGITDKAQ